MDNTFLTDSMWKILHQEKGNPVESLLLIVKDAIEPNESSWAAEKMTRLNAPIQV